MILRQDGEDPEEKRPDDHEEYNDKHHDLPWLSVVRAPEEVPISTIRCRQKEVLNNDGDEEPADDFTAQERFVE